MEINSLSDKLAYLKESEKTCTDDMYGKQYNSRIENELFKRISEGDELAFKKLFIIYKPMFSAIAFKITNNNAVVSDVLQETFLRIWLNRTELYNVEYTRGWALKILYRISFNWLRHQQVISKNEYNIRQLNKSTSNSVEEALFFKETKTLLQQAVNALPPQTQKIYRLNRENNLRIIEIAEQLGLSIQTIKNVLGKASRSIQKYLLRGGVKD